MHPAGSHLPAAAAPASAMHPSPQPLNNQLAPPLPQAHGASPSPTPPHPAQLTQQQAMQAQQFPSPALTPLPAPRPSTRSPPSANAQPAGGGPPASIPRRMVGDWVVESKIGSGSFATVWRGFHKSSGVACAIKSVNKERMSQNRKHVENLELEIHIMQRIRHDNIVQLYETRVSERTERTGAWNRRDTARHKYLILEYMPGGDLSKFLKRTGAMPERVAKLFLGQLALGVRKLRELNLIHRDLKPQNLLLSNESFDATLKIADFGFARFMEPNNLAATLCGSPLYMAPEILGYKEYDASVDLWSIGGILFEMLTGRPPFTGSNHIQLLNRINTTEMRIPPGIELSREAHTLIAALLKRNPRERITFEQFFAHPFVVDAMREAQAMLQRKKEQQAQQQQQQAQQSMQQKAEADASSQQQTAQTALPADPSVPPASLHPPAALLTDPSPSPSHAAAIPSPALLPSTAASASSSARNLSATPPHASSLQAQQIQQQQQLSQTQQSMGHLYGSSPAQGSYLNQALAHPPHPASSPQPFHSPQVVPSRASPSPTPAALPMGLVQPGSSPPSPGAAMLPAGQQRPPSQQQAAYPSPSLSPAPASAAPLAATGIRPISRQTTPQNLQILRSSGDGSTSLADERDYVLISDNPDANSQTSSTGAGASGAAAREAQASPQHFAGATQAAPLHPTSSFEFHDSTERDRFHRASTRAGTIVRMGDAKLRALVPHVLLSAPSAPIVPVWASSASTSTAAAPASSNDHTGASSASNVIMSLLDELGLLGAEDDTDLGLGMGAFGGASLAGSMLPSASSSTVAGGGSPSALDLLASALSLYMKALELLAPLLSALPRILAALERSGDIVLLSSWREVDDHVRHRWDEYLRRCQSVRRAMESLEAIGGEQQQSSAVKFPAASSASQSRRGSIAHSLPPPSLTDSPAHAPMASGSDEGSASMSASSSVAATRLLSRLSVPCAEKYLWDDAVESAKAGVLAEAMADYAAALDKYAQAMQLLEGLATDPRASDEDRAFLAGMLQHIGERVKHASKKEEQEKQQEATGAEAAAGSAPVSVH